MNPKIISLGYSVPKYVFSQKDIFDGLGYPRHWFRIFSEARIDYRHFLFPIEEIKRLSFQQQQEAYGKSAVELSVEAMKKTVDVDDIGKIGLLSVNSCTGFAPGPTIGHYVAKELGMKDIEIVNLSSMGCEGSMPGLRRCYDYTRVTGNPSVAISCELADLTFYPEDKLPEPENDWELLRANAVFGDGCSCALIGYDNDTRHPEIIDFASVMDTQYIDRLGYTWRNGRLRVRLCKDVPKIAVGLALKSIMKILERNELAIKDVAYWIFHPPGSIVLDELQECLHLSDEKMKYSREALRKFGNCSSATVGIVGSLLMQDIKNPKGYAVMVNVGPGMASNSVLLLWR